MSKPYLPFFEAMQKPELAVAVSVFHCLGIQNLKNVFLGFMQ